MKKISVFSLCVLAMAVVLTVPAREAQSSDAYSDQQKSAAISIELARHRVNTLGERCLSHDNAGYMLRFVLHLAAIDNMDVTLPADKVLATLTPTQRQKLEQRSRDEVYPLAVDTASCETFKADLRQGRLKYTNTNQDASNILRNTFSTDKKMRISKRDHDINSGCMKNKWNLGARSFDETLAQCECILQAIKHNASDSQIDSWLASLDQTPPWWAKMATEVMHCQ